MKQPLEGIRVLECAIFHAGPGAGAIMGDLGAEVIKVEQPGVGDPIRQLNTIGSIPFQIEGGGNVFCEGANRNKKSITVNLFSEKGQEIVYKLAEKSDVFLTNFRPQALEEMNITYHILKKINPEIIYASVTAFGDKGPEKNRGGFDYQGQAKSGLMFSMGEEGMPPLTCQFGIIDQATAFNASHQIITALFMRERFGTGQEVKISLLGSTMNMLYFNILSLLMGNIKIPRHKRDRENPLRNYYLCRDNRWLMMTLTPSDRFWQPLCEALERPDLADKPRFSTDADRLANAKELVSILDKIFTGKSRDTWLKIFEKYDLFCCGVNSLEEVINDPQVLENNYIVDFDHPVLGKIKIPGYPASFSGSRVETKTAVPDLGEHTEEVLVKLGGFSLEEISKLRDEGVC